MRSNTYFSCFLYACLKCVPFKTILLHNKILFSKIIFNNNIIELTLNSKKSYNIIKIKLKLIEFIKKIQIAGKYINVDDNIIFNDRLINVVDKKIENNILLNNINNIEMNKKKLLKLIESIADCELSYLSYKIDIDKYKNLLGDNFEMVNDILFNLKNFSMEISSDSSAKKLKLLCQSILNIAKYNKKIKLLDKKDLKFINIMKKIVECNNVKVRDEGRAILQLINYFWKYENIINNDDNIDDIFDKVHDVLNEEHKYDDPYTCIELNIDENIQPTDADIKWAQYCFGEIQLTDEELEKISNERHEEMEKIEKLEDEEVKRCFKIKKQRDKEWQKKYKEHELEENTMTHLVDLCKKIITKNVHE